MKINFIAILGVISLILCGCTKAPNNNPTGFQITDFSFPGVTIRALHVVNDSTVWFAGSLGVWGYTNNGGKSWEIDTLRIANSTPELRSIKITPNGNIFLVNVSQPAAIFKSENHGESWTNVYSDTAKNAFFDAVEFWDDQNGLMLGDAVNNCLHFAVTKDGGNTWDRIKCDSLPKALLNENPFAASNSNISLGSSGAWIPTGGKSRSRVFYTTNFGEKWQVSDTKIIWGETMTGIFSVDFLNDSIGVVAGGNWEEVDFECNNLALTQNGGKNWELLNNESNSGYISCIKFISETNGQALISLSGRGREGISSIGMYNFITKEWTKYENPKNYLSIKCASKTISWVSGKGWIGKMEITY